MSRSLSARIKEKLTGWLKKVFSKERDIVQYNTQVRQQQFLIPREFHVVSSQIVTSNFYEIPQHDNEPAGRRVKSFQQFLDDQQKQKDSDQQSDSANNQQSQDQRTNRHQQKNLSKKRKLNDDKQRVCIQISNDQKEVYKVEMANCISKDQPSEFKILNETKNPFVLTNGQQNVMKITHEKQNDEGISTSVLEIGIDPEIPLNQLEQLAKNKYIKSGVIQPMHSPKQQQEQTPKKKGLKRVNSNLDVSQEEKQNDPQTTPFFKSTRPAINVIVDKQEPNFKRDLFESLTQQISKNRQETQQPSPKNTLLQTPLINLSQLIKEEVKQEQPINILKPQEQPQKPVQTLQIPPQQTQIIEQIPSAQPQTEPLFKLGNIFNQPPLQGSKALLFGDTIKMMENKSDQKTIQQTIKQDSNDQKPIFTLFNNAFSQPKKDNKDLDIKPPQLITIEDDHQQVIKPLADQKPQKQIDIQSSQQTISLQQLPTQIIQIEQQDEKQENKQSEQDYEKKEQQQNSEQKIEQIIEPPKEFINKEEGQNKTDQTIQEDDKIQQAKEEISKPSIVPYQWPSKFQPRPETQLIKKPATLFNTPKPVEQEKAVEKIPEKPILIETPIKVDQEKKQESTPVALPPMNLDSIIEKVKQSSEKKQEQTPIKGELSFFKSLNDALAKQNDNKSNQQGGGQPQITLFGNSLNSTPQIDLATPKQSLFSFLNKTDQTEQQQPQQTQLNKQQSQPQLNSQQQQTQQILNSGLFAILQPSLFSQQSQPQAQQNVVQHSVQQPIQKQQSFQQQPQQTEQVNPFTIVPPKLDQAAIQGFFCKKASELQQIQSQRSSDQSQRNQLFENSTGLSLQSPLQNPSLQVSQGGIATPMIQQSLFVQQSPIQYQQQNQTLQQFPIYGNQFQQQGFMEQGNQMNMPMNRMNNNQMNTEVMNMDQMHQMNQFSMNQQQGMSMEEPQNQFTPIFSNQQIAQNQYPYQYQQSQAPLGYSQSQMDVTNSLINQASLFFQESSVPKQTSLIRKPQDNRKRL